MMRRRRPGRGLDQVADQAAEGEEKAGGCGEGGRGAMDGGGGLPRGGVGGGRGVVHWLWDTGGDDGGGDWAGDAGADDGGVLDDCGGGVGTGEC